MTDDGPILADSTLAMAADILDDLENVRIANENRLRTLTATDEYGHGLDTTNPDIKHLFELVADLTRAEHKAVLNLQRTMRRHPLGPFVKAHNGIGEKQAARLLAAIRDPYWHDLHDRPRKLRELYSFCGMAVLEHGPAQPTIDSQNTGGGATQDSDADAHGTDDSQACRGAGVAPKRQRGATVNWSPDARKRLWLVAAKCVMVTSSPYREIYDKARVKYADATHTAECKQCGPKGNPALPGSPLSAGHQHARAIRLIAKAILHDLWHEAQELHAAHTPRDSQPTLGGVD